MGCFTSFTERIYDGNISVCAKLGKLTISHSTQSCKKLIIGVRVRIIISKYCQPPMILVYYKLRKTCKLEGNVVSVTIVYFSNHDISIKFNCFFYCKLHNLLLTWLFNTQDILFEKMRITCFDNSIFVSLFSLKENTSFFL